MSDAIQLGHVAYRDFTLARECEENKGHLHHYDHLTVVRAGAVKVFWRKEGEPESAERQSRVFRAGEFFTVMRDTYHRIKAVEVPAKWACVYHHRDRNGLIVEEYEGHDEAYAMREEGTPALQDVHAGAATDV